MTKENHNTSPDAVERRQSMENIANKSVVEKQYKTADNLNTRISIHDKYSTNKMGFGNWISSHYDIPVNGNILELGCGTGDMWKSKLSILENGTKLLLSDFSEGMVSTARQNVGENDKVSYEVIDIENIPCETGKFHRVIANMMLYHVPDIDKGLSEVSRVLADDGYFYCATYGENGIVPFLARLLADFGLTDTTNKNFTLQNGYAILSKHFSDVERFDYVDSLAVTDLEDILDYIYSLSSMVEITRIDRADIKAVLEKNMVDGVLNIPKEYGMFVCKTSMRILRKK